MTPGDTGWRCDLPANEPGRWPVANQHRRRRDAQRRWLMRAGAHRHGREHSATRRSCRATFSQMGYLLHTQVAPIGCGSDPDGQAPVPRMEDGRFGMTNRRSGRGTQRATFTPPRLTAAGAPGRLPAGGAGKRGEAQRFPRLPTGSGVPRPLLRAYRLGIAPVVYTGPQLQTTMGRGYPSQVDRPLSRIRGSGLSPSAVPEGRGEPCVNWSLRCNSLGSSC
jgi:hypothetical protein